MPGWGNPHQVGKVLEYKVYPEWSLSLPVFESANSSLDENLRYFVVLVIPFFIFFLNPLFRTCIEIKGWQAYIGRVFSYLPKLPNPRKYPTTSLPARGGWHHSVFVLVVLPSNLQRFLSHSSGCLPTSWMSASESLECASRSTVSTWGTQLDAVRFLFGWEIEYFQM